MERAPRAAADADRGATAPAPLAAAGPAGRRRGPLARRAGALRPAARALARRDLGLPLLPLAGRAHPPGDRRHPAPPRRGRPGGLRALLRGQPRAGAELADLPAARRPDVGAAAAG